jgi:hypothetical protein
MTSLCTRCCHLLLCRLLMLLAILWFAGGTATDRESIQSLRSQAARQTVVHAIGLSEFKHGVGENTGSRPGIPNRDSLAYSQVERSSPWKAPPLVLVRSWWISATPSLQASSDTTSRKMMKPCSSKNSAAASSLPATAPPPADTHTPPAPALLLLLRCTLHLRVQVLSTPINFLLVPRALPPKESKLHASSYILSGAKKGGCLIRLARLLRMHSLLQ